VRWGEVDSCRSLLCQREDDRPATTWSLDDQPSVNHQRRGVVDRVVPRLQAGLSQSGAERFLGQIGFFLVKQL
jgi:hypothetical protein